MVVRILDDGRVTQGRSMPTFYNTTIRWQDSAKPVVYLYLSKRCFLYLKRGGQLFAVTSLL